MAQPDRISLKLPRYEAVAIPGNEERIFPNEIPSDELEKKSRPVIVKRIVYPTPREKDLYKTLMIYPESDKPRQYPLTFVDRIKQVGDKVTVYYTDPEGWTVQPDSFANARYGLSRFYSRKS